MARSRQTRSAATRSSGYVHCGRFDEFVLTHLVTPCGPVPTALDPDGVYPYVSYCETANRPTPKKYTFILLENQYLQVTVCPDLGGKVWSLIQKRSGKEILHVPDVIRPARILPRFYFVPGGIEVSFPISHSASQNERVFHKIERTEERVYVTCGERELRFGMQWSVEYSLGPEDKFLTERLLLSNPGTATYPWMSWSNAALPSAPDTVFCFPKGEVLSHSSRIETIQWEKQGPKCESDIREMTGFFWKTRDTNAFGAYTPSLGCGLYHVAEEAISPGMKLWSYGVGDDREWATLGSASAESYIEIQGGPVRDQSIKLELAPQQTHVHTEYWIPTDRPLEMYKLKIPDIDLRPVEKIPLFGWRSTDTIRVWTELLRSDGRKEQLPDPPAIEENNWAPSGMEDLGSALELAMRQARGSSAELWKFQYGAWLAGTGRIEDAIFTLTRCEVGVAKVLLSRIHRRRGELQEAEIALQAIRDSWLQLHPQTMVERDQVLRELGGQTLEERESWLRRVASLQDEWVIERRVQLLIDRGNVAGAKRLLLSTPFQRVHQRYVRTDLWMQVCEKLNTPCEPIPSALGEDRLARYGAYREFE